MEGSAIRRIGHTQWLRNLFVAMGNAPFQQRIIDILESHLGNSEMLDEHIQWALEKQNQQLPSSVQASLSAIPSLSENASKESVNKIESKKKRLIRIVEKGLPRDA